MAKAPVLKTGGRKPLQVRILCPPYELRNEARAVRVPLERPVTRLLWLALFLVCTRPLDAQTVRGQLVDSITRTPLGGAFLTLVDRDGQERARAITDASGQFTLVAPGPGTYHLRSKRIGFRPYVSPALSLNSGETTTYHAAIDPIPVPLKEVVVAGKRQCHVDGEGEAGTSVAALWEEIREALAAVAWAAGSSGYWYELTHFERQLTSSATPKRGTRDSVWREVGYHQQPFRSVPAVQLMSDGYVVVGDDGWTFYGPDATVLLSDPFLTTHCFETKSEKGLVGLAFSPASGREPPDIKGTLWVNRENAELKYLEFTYVRLPQLLKAPEAGGRVEFMRVPSGEWIVSDWVIRMPIAGMVSGAYQTAVPRVVGYHETRGAVSQIKTRAGAVVYRSAAADTMQAPGAPVATTIAAIPVSASTVPPPLADATGAAATAAPAVRPDSVATPPGKPMRDFDQLQREEFVGSMAVDAHGLVQEFRPLWLSSRGPSADPVRVYVDGMLYGDLNSLHSIPVLEIRRFRRLRAPEAAARYGRGHSAGAIEVWTR